ncbi:neuraminidase [Fomes fomentarius]|nr:neuraminidase [Fomes fomentarius]
MARPRGLLLALLATLITFAAATPTAQISDSLSTHAHSNHTLVRRAGLVPHVDSASIDLFPGGGGGAYPRVASLSDGSLLASFTNSNGNTRILTVTRSTDGGQTFSSWGEIARSDGDLDNTFLLQLANGDVLAAFRNHDLDADRAPTWYRITTAVSHDGGKTWAFLSQVAERAATATKNGLWFECLLGLAREYVLAACVLELHQEPFMRLSKSDGSLQVYYASENNDGDQDILLQTSRDNGATWSNPPVTIAGATTTGRDGMPGCANFNDGAQKLMCVFETTEGRSGGLFSVKSVVSTDEGVNWGQQRSQVYFPTGSNSNAGAPQIVQTSDGNLVVSFMTDEDASSHDWPNANVAFKIVTGPPVATGDWGHKTQVTAPQSAWPGLFAKSDGSVLACAGHAGEGAVCRKVTFTTS